jgi:[NiFe] hydrogenase assembly HybE family chaperone
MPATRPQPAAALERRFNEILLHNMRGVPMVNPALRVEAVGFRPWNEHWLGVLVTPWFMNLLLLPRVDDSWQAVPERESRHFVFPAGVFEFIGSQDEQLGNYLACSLFSPMFDFTDTAAAHDTAAASLAALFDAGNRLASEVPPAVPKATPTAEQSPGASAAPAATTVSKRGFLFGSKPPAEPHGP